MTLPTLVDRLEREGPWFGDLPKAAARIRELEREVAKWSDDYEICMRKRHEAEAERDSLKMILLNHRLHGCTLWDDEKASDRWCIHSNPNLCKAPDCGCERRPVEQLVEQSPPEL